jgi:ABC-2 type transport system permease protein
MALILPPDFDERVDCREEVTIGLVADGCNANQAAIGAGYMSRIAKDFSQEAYGYEPPLEVRYSILFNPEMESVYFMVPGIVATLLTMVTVMLTSMAVVREREKGTLEQLMVTPITRTIFLAGKLVPFAILGIFEMILALTVGVLWFGIPFAGSPVLLLLLSALYLGTTLGIGLLISTLTSTQQQAMFFAWFFFVFALLTSGFFTPIKNMPEWTQQITLLNPMRYFMSIVRAIMMKGSGITEMLSDIYPLLIYPVVVFTVAVLRFSKRIG